MGRLIDADALIEKLKRTSAFEYVRNSADKNVFEIIAEEPTAYDVDAVVEELEEFAKLAEDRWVNGTSTHAYQEHKCWVKAIDIVRKGGVE